MTKKIIPLEDVEQKALMDWCRLHPVCKHYMFAIPNGGMRNVREAAKLKRTGVKAGVPDLFLAYPNGTHHGLFIEMKRRNGNKPTKQQLEMLTRLQAVGYEAIVSYGWEYACEFIQYYLESYND